MSVVFLAMAFLSLIAAYNLYDAWTWMQHEERKRIMSNAESCAEQQRSRYETTENLLRSLSLFRFADQIDTSEFYEYMRAVYSSYSGYLRFEVLSTEGIRLRMAGEPGKTGGAPPEEIRRRFYFREAIKNRDFVVGELLDSYPGDAAIPTAMPIIDGSRHIQAVLVAVIDLGSEEPALNVLHRNYQTEILLFDRRGKLAYRYPESKDKKAELPLNGRDLATAIGDAETKISFPSRDSAGQDKLCAMVKLRASEDQPAYLYVLAVSPKKGFADFLTSQYMPQLAATILSFLLSLWLAARSGRRFFASGLEILAVRTRKIKHGDLSSRIESIEGCREIQILADGMNSMLDSLEAGNEKLRELSNTDELTGLCNRRKFYSLAEEEMKRSARSRDAFTIVLVDLDHFKTINDTYGHAAGDAVLKSFAAILRANTRKTDVTARFGGEEFIILLPETDQNGAMAVIEKIRGVCEADTVIFHGRHIRYTASFGAHVRNPDEAKKDGPSLESVVKKADEALYQSKNNGRNRISFK